MQVHFHYPRFADGEARHWEERLPRIPQVKKQKKDSVSPARWALLGKGTSNPLPLQRQLWAELSQLCPPGTDSIDLQCCCVPGIKKHTRSPKVTSAGENRASGCLSPTTGTGTTKPLRDELCFSNTAYNGLSKDLSPIFSCF